MQLNEQLLQPLIAARAEASERLDALKEQMHSVVSEVQTIDKVLKAAGYGMNDGKKKREQIPPSADAQRRVLDFVSKHVTVDAKATGEALGLSAAYAGKTLAYLRSMEQIRLVRMEAASSDGRGRKSIYGPWVTS